MLRAGEAPAARNRWDSLKNMWMDWMARLAGWRCARRKRKIPARQTPICGHGFAPGISVIIPSRNGKHLLERLLPGLTRELRGIDSEVIVSDNGSNDGTGKFAASEWPNVKVIRHCEPLSFARAVNAGIRRAQYSRTFLLNNDMTLGESFFPPLLTAFEETSELFCATAQIFFPPGRRREETGKTVWRPAFLRNEPNDFPVWCEEPLPGEDRTWVLYGSGGCSLYDTGKLLALGGLDESYEPAYVEDLDLGYHAWQCGWPSVFVAGAKLVHDHRATSSRYFSPTELQRALEVNYLRFLAKRIADPDTFLALWKEAVVRLAHLARQENPEGEAARQALRAAAQATDWIEAPPEGRVRDSTILAICSGAIARFPGSGSSTPRIIEAAELRSPEPAETSKCSEVIVVREGFPEVREAILHWIRAGGFTSC